MTNVATAASPTIGWRHEACGFWSETTSVTEASMSLDKVQEQIVSDWLQSKQVAAECPACRAEEWVILEMIEASIRWPSALH